MAGRMMRRGMLNAERGTPEIPLTSFGGPVLGPAFRLPRSAFRAPGTVLRRAGAGDNFAP